MSRLIDADDLLKGKQDHEMISTHEIWNAPTIEPCEDAISRADAIDKVCEYGVALERKGEVMMATGVAKQWAVDILEALPSVAPSRPSGEWVERTHNTLIAQVNFAYCSECGQPIMHEHTRPLWSFCPNCGARMKGADDEGVR